MNKGFTLIETVICVVTITIIAVPLYVLTRNVLNAYNTRNSYDTVENLYDLNSVKVFLYKNYDVNILCDLIDDNSAKNTIIPLYQISNTKVTNNIYKNFSEDKEVFESLMRSMGIELLLFTSYNDILDKYPENDIVKKTKEDKELENYIKYISKDYTKNQYMYRLIARFNNGNYSSINMYRLKY